MRNMETGATTLSFTAYSLASDIVGQYHASRAQETPLGIEIALITEDVPQAYAKAVENGATVLKEPVTKPWGQVVAYVRDLNGVLVEICTPVG